MLFKLISKGFVYVLSIMNYGVMAYLHFLVDVSLFLGKTLVKRIYAPNFPFFYCQKLPLHQKTYSKSPTCHKRSTDAADVDNSCTGKSELPANN